MAFSIIQRKLFASRIPFIPWPHFFLLSSAWKNRKLRSWNLPTFGPNYNSADCIAHSSQDFLWAASEKRLRLIHIFHALFTLYAQILNAMNPPTVLHICVPDPCSGLPKSGLHSPQSAVFCFVWQFCIHCERDKNNEHTKGKLEWRKKKQRNANKQLSTTADIAPSDPPTLTSKPHSAHRFFCLYVRATELRFSQVFVGLDLCAPNAYAYSRYCV